ncbi:MAG: ATP-binding protein [Flavobacteriaceae bacterium]
MNAKVFSIRSRVFVSMVLLILISSILIGLVTVFQYNEQSEEYNAGRLVRKENAIINHLEIELSAISDSVKDDEIRAILKSKINDIKKIHGLHIEIHSLDGSLIISSDYTIDKNRVSDVIVEEVLTLLANDGAHRFVEKDELNDKEYYASYSYLYSKSGKAIGILHIPYLENRADQENELREFLSRLALGFFLMFVIGMAFALFISRYITRSITTVSEKMNEMRLNKRNEKIEIKGKNKEIHVLIEAYNSMVDDLEESAVKLAQSEREEAWREMAKQVAHEIKNPLTPMRLTVQSFERKFDPTDPNIKQKLKEYSKTIIQQIDVMSSIASAFSDFAKMPTQKREKINIVEVVKHATEIFTESYISFSSDTEMLIMNLDKLQLTRIVTNLIKNATQAVESINNPFVKINVIERQSDVIIEVIDNGKGIDDKVKDKVFEPRFTTKTSGMGLGLPMIKNIIEAYGGALSFESQKNIKTIFTVLLPKD